MENSEIIDLAVMCMAVDQSPGDEAVAKRFTAALGAAVEEFRARRRQDEDGHYARSEVLGTSAARPPAPKTLGAPEGPLDLRAPLSPSHPIPRMDGATRACLCFVAGLGRGSTGIEPGHCAD